MGLARSTRLLGAAFGGSKEVKTGFKDREKLRYACSLNRGEHFKERDPRKLTKLSILKMLPRWVSISRRGEEVWTKKV